MKTVLSAALLALATSALAGTAAMAAEPAMIGKTAKGDALTDARGMTLYTFDKDSGGKSACDGQCAANWPPLMAEGMSDAPAGYTVVTRTDGGKQWAYKGKPLYTWVKDTKAGDVTGDGVGGVWHVAQP